ncbi:MAG: hypothetical protein ACLP3K_04080 [Candidatus Acidiferrales bacterium]
MAAEIHKANDIPEFLGIVAKKYFATGRKFSYFPARLIEPDN